MLRPGGSLKARPLTVRNEPRTLDIGGLERGGSMPDAMIDLEWPVPPIVPRDIPSMSDDECVFRLAKAIADRDSSQLNEVAKLIGRLAVTIE